MDLKPLYIFAHQGMGDQILCSGLYRYLAKDRPLCVVPTTETNFNSVSQMLADVENIRVEPYKGSYDNVRMDAHASLLKKLGFEVLRLGYSGKGFFNDPKKRLDENFYIQAGVNISERWDGFRIDRNPEKEASLFDRLVPKNSKYIFIHEDPSRGFDLDLDKVPRDVAMVRPVSELSKEFTVFDYLKIIENSWQIHCIESSFCALIESMQYDIPKYAHRYARPEAKADYRHEFTYRSKWEILL